MANDVSNLILKKVTEMQDSEKIYVFNHNLYRKTNNTSYDDFVKEIIKLNYEKCVKIIFKNSNKIGPYIDFRGVIYGNISIDEWENEIDISSFDLTCEEYQRLKSRFTECQWNISSNGSVHPRTCLCNSDRLWIRKNYENDKNEDEELDDLTFDERVVWGNWCKDCENCISDNIKQVRNDLEACVCLCDIHMLTSPSSIIVRPYQRYDSDHCDLFKNDIYGIFISSQIDILKPNCIDIIKRHVMSKKLTVI